MTESYEPPRRSPVPPPAFVAHIDVKRDGQTLVDLTIGGSPDLVLAVVTRTLAELS